MVGHLPAMADLAVAGEPNQMRQQATLVTAALAVAVVGHLEWDHLLALVALLVL